MRISDWSSDVCSSDLELLAQRLAKALAGEQLPVALVSARRLAVVRNAQLDVGARQRQRAQPFLDVAQFGALGAQELSPRRHVVEQVANLDRGAARRRLRGHFTELAAIDLQAGSVRLVVPERCHREPEPGSAAGRERVAQYVQLSVGDA